MVGLVSGLVGAGIYDLSVKDWRARLRGKTSVDEHCECLPCLFGVYFATVAVLVAR